MKDLIQHINIRVNGRVQGVWFRKSALEKALSLGLKGFVRNESDRSVYIEAEGEGDDLDKFVAWCRRGPDKAEVEGVDVDTGEVAEFSSFSINYR